MSTELEEFHQEFFQDVLAEADAGGRYVEDAFFELFCDQLVDAGELNTADRAPYVSPRGMRVDGYGGDPVSSDGILSLIIEDCNQSPEVGTLTRSEMEAIFKRASNFLGKSCDATFRNALEETAPGFGLADLIAARWATVSKVRLILISNRVLSARVDGLAAGAVNGTPVTYSVWDLARLHAYATSGRGREDIVIDLENDFGGSLAVLPAHLEGVGYEAYLVVFPAEQLAAIYDRWGARLLEQNVRVFLQARGKVNKDIRNTIENYPEMFFAYNNGVTATAEGIDLAMVDGSPRVTGFRNLQIVNGGQTTASLHAGMRKKDVDLSHVFVQMKLAIVQPEKALEVVPKISEYANSQNRVNAADFFANHPFHVRMEGFSRRSFAPSPDGTFRQSKWFYERARGQYQDARAYLTPAQKRKFDTEYPRRQVFSKTDLAKYEMVWWMLPHIVSRGAQKNFAAYASGIGKEWAKRPDDFNEAYYRGAIARAIIFREVEKLVSEQPWYEGGYRANIVAYAIARTALAAHDLGRSVDFDAIWQKQGASPNLREALLLSAKLANNVIVNPPAGMRNVTEWAKQQACWDRVASAEVVWPSQWLSELLTRDEQKEKNSSAVKDQKVLNGIEAQTAVVKAGGATWHSVKEWGVSRSLLSPTDVGILEVCGCVPDKIPSEKQCLRVLETLARLRSEGCPIGREVGQS